MKKKIFCILVFIFCFLSIKNILYFKTAEIIEVNNNIMVCCDNIKNLWEFSSLYNWTVGDKINLIMNNNKTPFNIYDDIIITEFKGE